LCLHVKLLFETAVFFAKIEGIVGLLNPEDEGSVMH
jgi:hypothetical protein